MLLAAVPAPAPHPAFPSADIPCDLSTAGTASFCNDLWTTSGGDFLWTHQSSGGTPSGSTGPDHGPNDGPYLFVEASSPNYPDKTCHLYSAVGQWLGVTFKYHMFGDGIGALLVETQAPGGAWAEVWRRAGAQQEAGADPWVVAHVAFGAAVERVRIVGVTDTWAGDTGLADIVLRRAAGVRFALRCCGVGNAYLASHTTNL